MNTKEKDITSRVVCWSWDRIKDITSRVVYWSWDRIKDITSRVMYWSWDQIKDITSRVVYWSWDRIKDITSRVMYWSWDRIKEVLRIKKGICFTNHSLTLTVPNPPIWIRFCTHPRGLGLMIKSLYAGKKDVRQMGLHPFTRHTTI